MAETKQKSNGNMSPAKVLAIVAAVLALEGAIIGATIWLTGPSDVRGEGGDVAADAEASDEVQELLVVREKFPNLRTGRQILYDMEVYITVRAEANEEDRMKDRLESRRAQIIMEIATIVRRAEPAYFNEPTLATLRRQIEAVLDERLGRDAEGEPVVQEVLITRCTPFRADF